MRRLWYGILAAFVLAALSLLAFTCPPAQAAGPAPAAPRAEARVTITLYSNYVVGSADPRTRLALELRDAHGRPKGRAQTTASSQGGFGVYLLDARGVPTPALGGDTLFVTDGAGATTSVPVVPLVARADWTTNHVFGQGPANAWVEVNLSYIRGTVLRILVSTPPTDAAGAFEVDYTGAVELAGGDHGSIAYRHPDGNIVRLEYKVPAVEVQVGGNWLTGTAWHAVPLGVWLLGSDGTPRAAVTTTTGLAGDFSLELRDRLDNAVPVRAGDRLELRLPGAVLPVAVPRLTAEVEPLAHAVSGLAPAGAALEVRLHREATGWKSVSVTAGADGEYKTVFDAGGDLRAGDYGDVRFTDPRGQVIWLRYVLPWLQVQAGGAGMRGLVAPAAAISATLTSTGGVPRGAGWALAHPLAGSFSTFFENAWDRAVAARPGDRVRVEVEGGPDLALDVPALTAAADLTLGVVAGEAPPGAALELDLRKPSGRTFHVQAQADAAGRYSASFAAPALLEAGDTGTVYHTLPSGHQVTARFYAPLVWLSLDDGLVGGQALPDTRVGAEVRDAAGRRLASGRGTAGADAQFVFTTTAGCDALYLPTPGSRVDLILAGQSVSLDVQAVTVGADASKDTLEGLAPAGTLVRLYLESRWAPPVEAATSEDGHYVLDLAGRVDLKAGDYGWLAAVGPGGHELRRRFAVPALRLQPGLDRVDGWLAPGTSFAASLRDTAGANKGSSLGIASARGAFSAVLRDVGGGPVYLAPGDRVEISVDGRPVLAAEVPALTVRVAVGSQVVTGTAPPASPVDVQLYRHGVWAGSRTETADEAGVYSATFEAPALAAGDYALVSVADPAGNRTSARANTLWMSLEAGGDRVSGRSGPGARVDVQVRDAGGVLRAAGSGTAALDTGAFDIVVSRGGQPAAIMPGDRVEVTGGAGRIELAVPELSLAADPEADVVTGTAPPDSVVQVTLFGAMLPGASPAVRAALAGPDGQYAAALRPLADLRYGDRVTVSLTTADGFVVSRGVAAPWLDIALFTPHVAGRVSGPGPVAVRLVGESGEARGSAEAIDTPGGGFDVTLLDAFGQPVATHPGDAVELSQAGALALRWTVPGVTARAGLTATVVTGEAAPGSPVDVELRAAGCVYREAVTADDAGAFEADFGPSIAPAPGDEGLVRWKSADGNAVSVRYAVSGYRLWLPAIIRRAGG